MAEYERHQKAHSEGNASVLNQLTTERDAQASAVSMLERQLEDRALECQKLMTEASVSRGEAAEMRKELDKTRSVLEDARDGRAGSQQVAEARASEVERLRKEILSLVAEKAELVDACNAAIEAGDK